MLNRTHRLCSATKLLEHAVSIASLGPVRFNKYDTRLAKILWDIPVELCLRFHEHAAITPHNHSSKPPQTTRFSVGKSLNGITCIFYRLPHRLQKSPLLWVHDSASLGEILKNPASNLSISSINHPTWEYPHALASPSVLGNL